LGALTVTPLAAQGKMIRAKRGRASSRPKRIAAAQALLDKLQQEMSVWSRPERVKAEIGRLRPPKAGKSK